MVPVLAAVIPMVHAMKLLETVCALKVTMAKTVTTALLVTLVIHGVANAIILLTVPLMDTVGILETYVNATLDLRT
jgi:hypothetical protein